MGASDIATLVKQAIDIVDVVGQAVPLRRVGNRHLGLCPFHQEKTPSFQVDADSQLYYCFGCGSGGDVLSFVMKHQNLTFSEAVQYLADRYHIALPQSEYGSQGGLGEASRKERDELFKVLQIACDYFYGQLHHSREAKTAREYILKRGLPEHIVETERIGYAPAKWDGLLRQLEDMGVDPELGVKAGLLTRSARDKLFDRFRNRLIFPIRDERNRAVAFGGRSLSGESAARGEEGASTSQNEPKYLNSPETALFHKGKMLYQHARAREACRQSRQVVLVEGYMDLLAFHCQGFYAVAATLGTALTAQQVRLLSRFADEVVLAYDGDDAGEQAMLRALPLFLQEELTVSCIRFPDGMDPDDFLKKHGLAAFEALVRERQDLGLYTIGKKLEHWDGSMVGKTKVLADLQPILDVVRQPVLKSEYLRLISARLSLSEEVIQHQLEHGRTKARPSRRQHTVSLSKAPRAHSIEESILRSMIKHPVLIGEVGESGAVAFFQEPRLKVLAEILVKVPYPPSGTFNATAVYDLIEDSDLKELFTCFLLESEDLNEAAIHMRDWLEALRERGARRQQLDSLNEALRQAQREGDTFQMTQVLAQLQSLHSARKKVKAAPDNV